MFDFNNSIQIFRNGKIVNQHKERLPQSGHYNFASHIIQEPKE